MILKLNGRRLDTAQVTDLIVAAGYQDLAAALAAQGYRMLPMRGPRAIANGQISIRMVWVKDAPDCHLVLRMTASVEALPA
jgi:hypothetical protein